MKETLEEAIERTKEEYPVWLDEEAFILGAKWQQKRSYSEEEVINVLKERDLHNCINMNGNNTWIEIPKWFEQFKKK